MRNLMLKAKIIVKFGSQSEFCRALGIREDRLSKIIHGRIDPSAQERKTIAKKLGVPKNELWPDC
jgi:transcriptional regulator with XRE-family HTH domain